MGFSLESVRIRLSKCVWIVESLTGDGSRGNELGKGDVSCSERDIDGADRDCRGSCCRSGAARRATLRGDPLLLCEVVLGADAEDEAALAVAAAQRERLLLLLLLQLLLDSAARSAARRLGKAEGGELLLRANAEDELAVAVSALQGDRLKLVLLLDLHTGVATLAGAPAALRKERLLLLREEELGRAVAAGDGATLGLHDLLLILLLLLLLSRLLLLLLLLLLVSSSLLLRVALLVELVQLQPHCGVTAVLLLERGDKLLDCEGRHFVLARLGGY